jgi:hypothetical protein
MGWGRCRASAHVHPLLLPTICIQRPPAVPSACKTWCIPPFNPCASTHHVATSGQLACASALRAAATLPHSASPQVGVFSSHPAVLPKVWRQSAHVYPHMDAHTFRPPCCLAICHLPGLQQAPASRRACRQMWHNIPRCCGALHRAPTTGRRTSSLCPHHTYGLPFFSL